MITNYLERSVREVSIGNMRPSFGTSGGGCPSLFARNLLLLNSFRLFEIIFFLRQRSVELDFFRDIIFLVSSTYHLFFLLLIV